jgi:TldD protein
MQWKKSSLIFLFLTGFLSVGAQDKLLGILQEELNRNMLTLQDQQSKPYYISYRVNDQKTYRMEVEFGQLVDSGWTHDRKFTIAVRVGDPALDNTHPVTNDGYYFFRSRGPSIPVEDSALSIKQVLWRFTDVEYRKAMEDYSKVIANQAITVGNEDTSPDFSIEKPVTYYEPPLEDKEIQMDVRLWEERLKRLTAILLQNPDLLSGTATLIFTIERKYFVATDGSSIVENRMACRVFVSGDTKAEDGMFLPLYNSYFAFSPANLPAESIMLEDTKTMSALLSRLKTAPVADSYSGPAILASESAGVFFHEIFGHRIEGQRLKDETDAQTFKKKVGEKVLNENLSIVFDPTVSEFRDFYLNGAYKYDDQGQPAKRVDVIKNGVLIEFLMSRTPIEGFSNSNGHGRAQAGLQPVSRQSNMFVSSNRPKSTKELRSMLIKEAKKQGKEYGYLFVSTQGGFTMTGRFIPNAFNVTPLVVYRIYADGRPDELVRGVDLVGTPLSIFSNIAAAGDDYGLFTGTCGAESGGVPVSTVCPSLFVRQIETQRKPKSQSKLPILPRP